MLEVLGSDYIKFARLKGLHEQVVLWKHGLRNALLPVVTFAVLLFVQFLGGAVVTETVFAWPGLGRLILESITTRDYPIVQAGVLVLSALYLTGNLFVDLLYSYLNPRIRHARRRRELPWFPGVVLAALVVTAVLAPFLAPHSPTDGDIAGSRSRRCGWSGASEHPLGTDRFGRDVLSRIIYGSRISLVVSLIAIGVAGTLGRCWA